MKDKRSKKPRIVIEYDVPSGVQYADLNDSLYPFYVNALASVKDIPPTMENLVIRGSDESSGLEITFEPPVNAAWDTGNEAWDTGYVTANVYGYQNGVITGHKAFEYQIERVEPEHDQPLSDFSVELINPAQVQVEHVHVFYTDDYSWAREDIQEILAYTAPLYDREPPPDLLFHEVSGYDDIVPLELERITQVIAISEPDHDIMVLPELDPDLILDDLPDLILDDLNEDKARTFHVPQEWMYHLFDRLEFASLAGFQQKIENTNTVALVMEGQPPPFIPKLYNQIAYDPILSKLMGAVLGYLIVHRFIESIWRKKKE